MPIPAQLTTAQDKADLISELRARELFASRRAVRDAVRKDDPLKLNDYADEIERLTYLIDSIETAALNDLANEFDYLKGDLKAGLTRLDGALTDLETAKKVINAIGTVVDTLSRLVAAIP